MRQIGNVGKNLGKLGTLHRAARWKVARGVRAGPIFLLLYLYFRKNRIPIFLYFYTILSHLRSD